MNDLSAERTPLVIAAEIKMITHQTRKILLAGAIEIGRRLQEAKSLIKRGEWGRWLEESVGYSQRTAERLMQLYEEYGSSFLDGQSSSNSSPVTNLTYTQAVLLLSLPEDEREEFITQNDVPGMTKQELQQALKDRDQAKREKEQALHEKNRALHEKEVLKKGLEAIDSAISELKKEQAKVPPQPANPENNQAEDLADDAASSSEEASSTDNTPAANNTASESTILFTHNLPTGTDPDIIAKYAQRCDTCRETIAKEYWELLVTLNSLASKDPELKEQKRKEALELAENMVKSLKKWPPDVKFRSNS